MRHHRVISLALCLILIPALLMGAAAAWSATRGATVVTKFSTRAGDTHFTITSKLASKWTVQPLNKATGRRAMSGGSVRGCVIATAGYNAFAGTPNTRASTQDFLRSVINTPATPATGTLPGHKGLAVWGVVQDKSQRRFHAVVAVNTVERGENGTDVGYRAFEVVGSYGITGSAAQRAKCDREASALITSLRTSMRYSRLKIKTPLPKPR